jgi:hypothetical protein
MPGEEEGNRASSANRVNRALTLRGLDAAMIVFRVGQQ